MKLTLLQNIESMNRFKARMECTYLINHFESVERVSISNFTFYNINNMSKFQPHSFESLMHVGDATKLNFSGLSIECI